MAYLHFFILKVSSQNSFTLWNLSYFFKIFKIKKTVQIYKEHNEVPT